MIRMMYAMDGMMDGHDSRGTVNESLKASAVARRTGAQLLPAVQR